MKKIISTGKWGCGVFKGNTHLKFIIQWLAASESSKEVAFHTYDDKSLKTADLVMKKYANETVGELFKRVLDFQQHFYNDILDVTKIKEKTDTKAFDTLLFDYLLK